MLVGASGMRDELEIELTVTTEEAQLARIRRRRIQVLLLALGFAPATLGVMVVSQNETVAALTAGAWLVACFISGLTVTLSTCPRCRNLYHAKYEGSMGFWSHPVARAASIAACRYGPALSPHPPFSGDLPDARPHDLGRRSAGECAPGRAGERAHTDACCTPSAASQITS